MSYTVLARKWRPKKFSELVGQAHVMQALANALDQQRLHHAYLFTGTRGVGKTTIARIFSKALNCEQGMSSTPCGVCDTCRSIDEGRFIDLIEVDAASKTKVDDTREILDNVQFAPTQGRYKVYLIDEVHMLSKSSFNALLKTLEEPPEHVKFLLATTDPHKLPMTVLSRCLQFNLMRLTPLQIQTHLAFIMEQEGLAFEMSALALIAKGADGSARDALSLLDQAIAYGAGEVLFEPVQTMLGLVDQQYSLAVLQGLAANDPEQVKQSVQQLAAMGVDYQALLSQLIETLHALSYYQVFGENAASMSLPDEVLITLAGQMSPEKVQLLYQIALLAKQDMQLAPDIRIGFEMALIRMLAFQPASSEALVSARQAGNSAVKSTAGAVTTSAATIKPSHSTTRSNQGGHAPAHSASFETSNEAEVKNALAGLASARSLVGKKIVPRTDFIKETSTTDYTDEGAEAESDVNKHIETTKASAGNQPDATFMDTQQAAASTPNREQNPSEQVFAAMSDSEQSLGEPYTENPAPSWEQSCPNQPDESFAHSHDTFEDRYAGDDEQRHDQTNGMVTSKGFQDERESISYEQTEPYAASDQSQPQPQSSNSDHLARIKERLKQPLGKPSRPSERAVTSASASAVNLGSESRLVSQSEPPSGLDPVLDEQEESESNALSLVGTSLNQASHTAEQSQQTTSPAMTALNQLQAMQASAKQGEFSGTEGMSSAVYEDEIVQNEQGFDGTKNIFSGLMNDQEESQESPRDESQTEVFGEIRYEADLDNWLEIIRQLGLKGMAAEIARNSVLVEFSAVSMAVSVDPEQNYSNQEIAFGQLTEAVKTRFGESMLLEFVAAHEHFTPTKQAKKQAQARQADAVQSIEQDGVVQAFNQQLGVEIIADSIQPV